MIPLENHVVSWHIKDDVTPDSSEESPREGEIFKGYFRFFGFPGYENRKIPFSFDNRAITVKNIKDGIGEYTKTDSKDITIYFYTLALKDELKFTTATNAHGLGTEIFRVCHRKTIN